MRTRFTTLIVFLSFSLPGSVWSDSCSQQDPRHITSPGSIFNISSISAAVTPGIIGQATDYWSKGCPGYGTAFPTIQAGGNGGIPISVDYQDKKNPVLNGPCGNTAFSETQTPQGRTVNGASITLYKQQNDGGDCLIQDTLAHELGHILGLGDAPNPRTICAGRIMGERLPLGKRSVVSDDCAIAGSMWKTDKEGNGGQPPKPCPEN